MPHVGEFCEIRHKRYEDLTDRDVIRVGSAWEEESGGWREVLDVYREPNDVYAVYSAEYLAEPYLQAMVEQYLDHAMGSYVLIRVLIHEKSADGEVVDRWLVRYRYALAEVQSLPTWERKAEEGDK